MAKKQTPAHAPTKIDTPDNRELSAPVSRVVKVKGIRLIECHAQVSPSSVSAHQQIGVEHRSKAEREGTSLRVTIDVRVWTQSERADRLLDIAASYLLTYDVGEHEFDQAQLDAFAALNGMFNLWPYIREFVQSMSVRMGLPALTLPVYRPTVSETTAVAAIQPADPHKNPPPAADVARAPKKRASKKSGRSASG